MMTSQSDLSAGEAGPVALPVFFSGSPSRHTRSVVRLRFEALDHPVVAASDEAVLMSGQNAAGLEAKAQERIARQERESDAFDEKASLELKHVVERRELEAAFEDRLYAERVLLSKTCEDFRSERQRYFSQVEAEVVRLALAIAARVLHREVKLDPMLLQGVAKVALGKVADESGTTLRVPLSDLATWQNVMDAEGQASIVVSGDQMLGPGECILETRVGRVELGVDAQLGEIEKGFFDLLQHRPV